MENAIRLKTITESIAVREANLIMKLDDVLNDILDTMERDAGVEAEEEIA